VSSEANNSVFQVVVFITVRTSRVSVLRQTLHRLGGCCGNGYAMVLTALLRRKAAWVLSRMVELSTLCTGRV
jgi:hypothetical protein